MAGGAAAIAALKAVLADGHVHEWRKDQRENPYLGYLALADALADAGHPNLALLARRAAAARKETNAVASLATVLTRVGWEAARSSDRAHAIRLLREAKALILKG